LNHSFSYHLIQENASTQSGCGDFGGKRISRFSPAFLELAIVETPFFEDRANRNYDENLYPTV